MLGLHNLPQPGTQAHQLSQLFPREPAHVSDDGLQGPPIRAAQFGALQRFAVTPVEQYLHRLQAQSRRYTPCTQSHTQTHIDQVGAVVGSCPDPGSNSVVMAPWITRLTRSPHPRFQMLSRRGP